MLLLVNFFLLELINDRRWGAIVSTLLAAVALVVAISDPDAGEQVSRTQAILIVACVALAPIVLVVDSAQVVGLAYLLPVALLVCATLPITILRVLKHQRVTSETVLGALCSYVLRRPVLRLPSTWRSASSATRPSSSSRASTRSRSTSTTASSR